MKQNHHQVARQSSRHSAVPQSKTHGADGATAQTQEALLKLVRSHATWRITSDTTKALHRTLDGQLILADRKPADMSGYIEYTGARPVSYAEACKWIPTSGNRWKPEVLLQFHGITDPARAVTAEQSKPGQSNAVDKTSQLAGFAGDPAELVPPPGGEVGVVIYDYDRDDNIAEFNLTAAEFARIRDAIAKTVDRPVDREAVTNFVRESLLQRMNRALCPDTPFQELELAIAHANGLIHLLLSYQTSEEADGGRDANRQHAGECYFLCESTRERLQSAFNAVLNFGTGRAA